MIGLQSMSSKSIEIDTTEIRIKGKKGTLLESFSLPNLDKIVVQNQYRKVGDQMADIKDEALGKYNKHFIILNNAEDSRELYFEIDSHYMIKQLEKVIDSWKENYNLVYSK